MITKDDIFQAQKEWGEAIVEIGRLKNNRSACETAASRAIDTLYGYESGTVLFKPTKAAEKPFRGTKEGALSYFIGGNENYPEDSGFAIQPWTNVRFENTGVICNEQTALAMGHYYFTDANTKEEVKVEYTFGYRKDSSGRLRINLHHSSLPYTPPASN